MKTYLPMNSLHARGSFANSITFSNNRAGSFAQAKVRVKNLSKFNPRTDIQQINRDRLSNATFFYQLYKNDNVFKNIVNTDYFGKSIYNKICSLFLKKYPAYSGLCFLGDVQIGEDLFS